VVPKIKPPENVFMKTLKLKQGMQRPGSTSSDYKMTPPHSQLKSHRGSSSKFDNNESFQTAGNSTLEERRVSKTLEGLKILKQYY